MHQIHQAFHCDGEKSYTAHTYPPQYTQHAPFLFLHQFLLSTLCLLNNRSAQRRIVFSDLLPALKTHSLLAVHLKVLQLAFCVTASLFFLYKQPFPLHSSRGGMTGKQDSGMPSCDYTTAVCLSGKSNF